MSQTYDDWDDQLEEDRKESGSRNVAKKWGYLFRPTEAPTKIHFSLPEKPYIHPRSGKEFQFRPGKRHFIPKGGKNRRGAFIECGKDFGEDCVVCAYTNPQAYNLENVAKDAFLSDQKAAVYYAVAGWLEEEFHLTDCWNDEADESKGTHKERLRCQGRGCEDCQDGWPKVFGKKFYMEISAGQWRHSIHELHKRIQNRHCQCGGDIFVTSFACGKCEKLVLDVSTTCDCGSEEVGIDVETGDASCDKCGSTWSAYYTDHKKIYEESKETYSCKCGHRGYLVPQRFCSTEGCDVQPHGVFDCQLTIKTTGTNKEKRLIIEDWKIQPPDERLFDADFQGEDELAEKVADAHTKPLDLNYYLNPVPSEDQAKELNRANPFTAASRGVDRYAKYDSEEEGEEEDTE